ncbi:hypothetical protein [Streptomyces sp. NPDC058664]|uniref:hypothetical protein n=1 Tax=unclassified Streptomyces TaxID=2593676 RepID=UPI003649BB8C
MTYYPRDGRPLVNGHDMNTGGRGSTSRGDTAGGQDPTDTASRNHAAMRRRQIAESAAAVSHNDMMADHYAERAAAREAEQREAESFRNLAAWSRELESRNEAERRFIADDPEPDVPDTAAADYSERIAAWSEWVARKEQHEIRAEGEDIAARIFNRINAPWL